MMRKKDVKTLWGQYLKLNPISYGQSSLYENRKLDFEDACQRVKPSENYSMVTVLDIMSLM